MVLLGYVCSGAVGCVCDVWRQETFPFLELHWSPPKKEDHSLSRPCADAEVLQGKVSDCFPVWVGVDVKNPTKTDTSHYE